MHAFQPSACLRPSYRWPPEWTPPPKLPPPECEPPKLPPPEREPPPKLLPPEREPKLLLPERVGELKERVGDENVRVPDEVLLPKEREGVLTDERPTLPERVPKERVPDDVPDEVLLRGAKVPRFTVLRLPNERTLLPVELPVVRSRFTVVRVELSRPAKPRVPKERVRPDWREVSRLPNVRPRPKSPRSKRSFMPA